MNSFFYFVQFVQTQYYVLNAGLIVAQQLQLVPSLEQFSKEKVPHHPVFFFICLFL